MAGACRDYCSETWQEALNLVGVPSTLEWREARNIFYPFDIHGVPANLPSSPEEQVSTIESFLPPPKAPKEPSHVSEQGLRVEKAKDKGNDPTSMEAKEVAEAKDATTKAKESEDKSKDAAKAKGLPASKS